MMTQTTLDCKISLIDTSNYKTAVLEQSRVLNSYLCRTAQGFPSSWVILHFCSNPVVQLRLGNGASVEVPNGPRRPLIEEPVLARLGFISRFTAGINTKEPLWSERLLLGGVNITFWQRLCSLDDFPSIRQTNKQLCTYTKPEPKTWTFSRFFGHLCVWTCSDVWVMKENPLIFSF